MKNANENALDNGMVIFVLELNFELDKLVYFVVGKLSLVHCKFNFVQTKANLIVELFN